MTDLDKKLEEIAQQIYYAGNEDTDLESGTPDDSYVKQITQAFIDAGWRQSHCYICERQFSGNDSMVNPTGHRVHKTPCVPPYKPKPGEQKLSEPKGVVWNLKDKWNESDMLLRWPAVLEAAKKAAGIE